MKFELPELPFGIDALEPHISSETLDLHHGKHHAKYVETLNELLEDSPHAGKSLEEILEKAKPGKIFNNAAQHWNHSFYWQCLSPDGGREPSGSLREAIDESFGGLETFRSQFDKAAEEHFGSGWIWLVYTKNGKLEVQATHDADNPVAHGDTPLVTCDVWEHAYYADYRNERPKYVEAFWKVVDWDFATAKLEEASKRSAAAA